MQKFKRLFAISASCLFILAPAIAAPAQTLTVLYSFSGGGDGAGPQAPLVQATDGNFYGSADEGTNNYGTIFRISSGGAFTVLHTFELTDGAHPEAALIQAANGNFYGTAPQGGSNGYGTLFELTLSGTFTALHNFCSQSNCRDGATPQTALVQAANQRLFGTTGAGGTNGYGTLFRANPNGTPTILYNFCSQSGCADGLDPYALIQAADGSFYGTTVQGGSSANCTGGCGTVFRITLGGTLTTLHSFDLTDGGNPYELIQAIDGNFYGTTLAGGTSEACVDGCGTVFKITPGGTLTTLHSFDLTDGKYPSGALVQATDGSFYGTTLEGGDSGSSCLYATCGTIFKITPAGRLTTLYDFCSLYQCYDGANPVGGLIQSTDGNFYGTAETGGSAETGDCSPSCGTVFRLSVGLGPFVETQTTSGRVGAHVNILGTSLTGATGVTFNGTSATFTVVSPSLITTTVPAGATTGTVQVVTPGGTLSSNVPFRVIP